MLPPKPMVKPWKALEQAEKLQRHGDHEKPGDNRQNALSPSFGAQRSTAAENEQGAQLAAMCAACHRLDGRDQGIPSIIGLSPKKLSEAMEAFRSGKRSSQIMNVVARSLSIEEIAALAEYLATRKRGSEQP